MFSNVLTFIGLTIAAVFALSVMADNGYPNAVLLLRGIKDNTGLDLTVLTDTTSRDSQIDWRQRLKDKINELKAAEAKRSQSSSIRTAASTGGNTGATDQVEHVDNGADAPSTGSSPATPQPNHSLPAFDWSLAEEEDPVHGTRTRFAQGVAKLPDGSFIEARAQASHIFHGNQEYDYEQDFKFDFTLTAFGHDERPKPFIDRYDSNLDMNKIFSEIKVGNNPPHTNMTFERFGNEITISFYDLEKFKKLIGYGTPVNNRGAGRTGPDQLLSGFFGAMNQIATSIAYNVAAASSGGTLDQLAKSDKIVVELAFEDGSKGYVDLAPQNINLVALTVPLFKATVPADNDNRNAAHEGTMAAKPNWCSRAATAVEILICDTPKLAAADIKIAAIYTALKNSPNPPVSLGKGMTAFLTQRNACQSITAVPGKIECIDGVYAKWIGILQSH